MDLYRQTASLRASLRDAEQEFSTIDNKLIDVVKQLDECHERWSSRLENPDEALMASLAAHGSATPSSHETRPVAVSNEGSPAATSPDEQRLNDAIASSQVATRPNQPDQNSILHEFTDLSNPQSMHLMHDADPDMYEHIDNLRREHTIFAEELDVLLSLISHLQDTLSTTTDSMHASIHMHDFQSPEPSAPTASATPARPTSTPASATPARPTSTPASASVSTTAVGGSTPPMHSTNLRSTHEAAAASSQPASNQPVSPLPAPSFTDEPSFIRDGVGYNDSGTPGSNASRSMSSNRSFILESPLDDSLHAEFQLGKVPHFSKPSSVPSFWGDYSHWKSDLGYFDAMETILKLSGLFIVVQYDCPDSFFAIKEACFAAILMSLKGAPAKRKGREFNSGHGDARGLWSALRELCQPLTIDTDLLYKTQEDYLSVKLIPTGNPYLDLMDLTARQDAILDTLADLEVEWTPTPEERIRIFRDNVPPELLTAGIIIHLDWETPDSAFAGLCKFALAHCKVYKLPTLREAGTATGFAAQAKSDRKSEYTTFDADGIVNKEGNVTTVRPALSPSKEAPYCKHQGHRRGKIPPGATIYTIGHLEKDCSAKKSHLLNGDPKKGPHRPGPKCTNCNQLGHKRRDCKKPKKAGTCFRCGKPGHQAAKCRALLGATVLLANGTEQITVATPHSSDQAAPPAASAFVAAAQAAAQPLPQPTPAPPATPVAAAVTAATTPAPGHYWKHSKIPAGMAATTVFGLLCAMNIPLTAAACASMAPASFTTDSIYDVCSADLPVPIVNDTEIPSDNGMSFYTGANPIYTTLQPMDSGATHGTIGIDVVNSAPPGTFFDWSHVDPTFSRPPALAFGNHEQTATLQAVGEYKYMRLRNGECADILYGPTLVTAKPSYRLQSADQHVQLHSGEIRHNQTGMSMHYQNGDIVDFVKSGGLYNVPKGCIRPHANPSIVHGYTLTLPSAPPTSASTTTSTGLLALAAVVDGTARQPSEHYDASWQHMLRNLGYSQADAKTETELMHTHREAESVRLDKERGTTKPSKRFDILNATWGYQGRRKTQAIATAEDITLSGRDKMFNIPKAIGSSTAAPMYNPRHAITVATPHKWSRIAFDDINGMPTSFHHNYTSMLVIAASTGRTRVYFNKHDQTTDTATKNIDRYLADSGMHRGGFRLGPDVFRSDSAKKFTCEKFKNNTAARGAINIYSAPQDGKLQNHEVEGEIRIGMSMMLSMLWSVDLAGTNVDPLSLWPYALRHAYLLKAMSPPSKPGRSPPMEYETGIDVDRSHIKAPWGSVVGVHIVADDRLKLEPHVRLGFYLGQTEGGHPDTSDVLMIDTKKIKSSRSLIFNPWPTTKIMPSTYDFGLHFGDIVHDPVADRLVTVVDETELPPPPPPLPTTTNAFSDYTAIAPVHLSDDTADTDTAEADVVADAVPPRQSTTDTDQVYSTPVNYKTKPGRRFHIGQHVDVDYTSENDGIWHGTVVAVSNKQIEVDFGVGYALPSIFRSNKLHTVQPSATTTSPDGIVLAALRDVSTATATAFTQIAAFASNTATAITNFVPTTLICAAMLCSAVAPNAAITSIAVHQDIFATTSDFITTATELADPSTYQHSFALSANGVANFEDDANRLEVALAFGAQQQYTLSQVKQLPDSEDWLQSCKAEFEGLEKNDTWNLVRADDPLVDTCDVVDMKMFFTKKCDQNGNLLKRKCRSVGRGDQATFGIGYLESNAPTPTFDAIRTLCSIAAVDDLNLTQHDFTQAFVSTDMTIKNTMLRFQQDEGGRLYEFADGTRSADEVVNGEQGVELLGHAQKSIYGLTDSFANMNGEVVLKCNAAGFQQSPTEPCLFSKITERGHGLPPHVCHMLIYVDDMLIAATDDNPDEAELLKSLDESFKRTGGDDACWFLGWHIRRDRSNKRLRIDQAQMIKDTCAPLLGSTPSKPTPTVLPAKFVATKLDCPQTEAEKIRFQAQAVRFRTGLGKMLYIARSTRPDIQPALSVLGRYTSNPGPVHTKALRHVAWYLHNTSTRCLDYHPPHDHDNENVLTGYEQHLNPGASNANVLVGYTDADWAGDRDTRRSQSGYIAILNCSPVSWHSRKQPVVAMSTMESELISLTAGALIIVFLRNLLADLNKTQQQPTVLNEDNKATISVAHNRSVNRASRHIGVRHFKVKELIADGTIVCTYCPSFENKSDIMTKNVDANTLDRHLSNMLGRV